ncbi:hypothetical protein HOF65_08430 [bacterium]|jgi:hypothetical protein|nr:hypothetical protein [bacterium]
MSTLLNILNVLSAKLFPATIEAQVPSHLQKVDEVAHVHDPKLAIGRFHVIYDQDKFNAVQFQVHEAIVHNVVIFELQAHVDNAVFSTFQSHTSELSRVTIHVFQDTELTAHVGVANCLTSHAIVGLSDITIYVNPQSV